MALLSLPVDPLIPIPQCTPRVTLFRPMLGPQPAISAAHADFEVIRPRAPGGLCHPVEKIVPEMTDFGGPRRVIDVYNQGFLIETNGLHVAGHGRSGDLFPLGEQGAEPEGSGERGVVGERIEGAVEGSWPTTPSASAHHPSPRYDTKALTIPAGFTSYVAAAATSGGGGRAVGGVDWPGGSPP